jgi:seryl-tRNA synthetase
MHNIDLIIKNFDNFIDLIKTRKTDPDLIEKLSSIPNLNTYRKELETKKQILQAENNNLSNQVQILKKNKQEKEASEQITLVKANSAKIKDYENELEKINYEIKTILDHYPNTPLHDASFNLLIPQGDEENFKVIKSVGKPKDFTFKPLTHEEIGEKYGYIDFKQTAKISGSRFVTLKGKVAHLEQALIKLMLGQHTKHHGYELISPPYMVKNEAMYGVGQLPKFSEDSFIVTSGPEYQKEKNIQFNEGYRLIPTAEVPLTNMAADKITNLKELPIRYVAVTPCFRSEVGSAGRDVTGIIRLHQFMKVELVSLVNDDEREKIIKNLNDEFSFDSESELNRMTWCACRILDLLELPYRIILLPTGDTGFTSHITYDIEVWMPSQNRYREISSCSYFGDFQTRRLGGRYKDNDGKNKFLHSLNGSALAIGRTIAAIVENYQNSEGDFEIPKCLMPLM